MSVPVCVIAISFISIIPLPLVVYSTACPLFIFTVNFAPVNFSLFSLSTFTICKSYEPVIFSFGTVTVIKPLLKLIVLPAVFPVN